MSNYKESEYGNIPQTWEIKSVEDLIANDVIERPMDGNHGEKHPKGTDFVESGIPFVMATDIVRGQIDLKTCKFISRQLADSLDKGFSIPGDVLLTHKASLGRTAIVGKINVPYLMLTPQVTYYRIKKDRVLHNRFLKYFFDSPKFQETFLNHGDSGSTRSYVGITAQRELGIVLPTHPEQCAIAAVLSSLDDKIDLLQHQNKTLEAMAQTLFRQWFVEEKNEKWDERPLSGIAHFLNGLACQKFPPENEIEKLPVLKIRELSNGFSKDSDWATSKIDPDYVVRSGDVIFSWSASLMVKIWDGEKSVLNQHLFKVTSKEFPKWFYFLWCKHHLAEFISISSSHATTMGHIKRGDLDNAMVLVPSQNELDAMDKTMGPIMAKHISNSKQIKSLEKTRDTLLPKLMSAEVRVST